jgi:hypothetical protein
MECINFCDDGPATLTTTLLAAMSQVGPNETITSSARLAAFGSESRSDRPFGRFPVMWRNLGAEVFEQWTLVAQIDMLPPDMQEQVLRFMSSLQAGLPKGESGAMLRRFSGSLDRASAQEMIQAIEEECERADACEW